MITLRRVDAKSLQRLQLVSVLDTLGEELGAGLQRKHDHGRDVWWNV